MRYWLVLSIAVALVGTGSALAQEPTLRTAVALGRHIVVTFRAGDLLPGEIAVATRPERGADGAFLRADVRLRERVTAKPDPQTGIVRFRTRGTVVAGAYYVAVSGILQDPPPSCFPRGSRCAERWSNAVRVVVGVRRARAAGSHSP